jgi:hypothetical protein
MKCVFCKDKDADERSEYDMCMKCHFDLTDEILGVPSNSEIEDPRNDKRNYVFVDGIPFFTYRHPVVTDKKP